MIPKTLKPLIVDIDSVEPIDDNPREGDVGAIAESLNFHGQYRPIVVNERADVETSQRVLAGNHTWRAAKHLGWTQIAATFVDVDDVTARRIVLVDNRANDLASYDESMLAAHLSDLSVLDDELSGTGFSLDDFADLLEDLETDLATELAKHEKTQSLDVVAVRIGDYLGTLTRSTYDLFVDRFEAVREAADTLDDVFRRWITSTSD